jgi:hypothetical protein
VAKEQEPVCIVCQDPTREVVAGGRCRTHYQQQYRLKEKNLPGTEAVERYTVNQKKILRKAHAKILDGLTEAAISDEDIRKIEAIIHPYFAAAIGHLLGWPVEKVAQLEGTDAEFEPETHIEDAPIEDVPLVVEPSPPLVVVPEPAPLVVAVAVVPPDDAADRYAAGVRRREAAKKKKRR